MKARRSGMWLGLVGACIMAVGARAETFYLPAFTNYSFSSGDFSQWIVGGGGTKQVINDPQAEDGKAAYCQEFAVGISVRTDFFVPITGVVAIARFFNPQGISSCSFIVFSTNGTRLVDDQVEDASYVTKTYDLSPFAGQQIQVGFGGGWMQIDYLKILWENNLKIYTAVELEYGAATGRTYQLQYTDALSHTNVWNNLGTSWAATNSGPHSWFDSIRQTAHRFYRVTETP